MSNPVFAPHPVFNGQSVKLPRPGKLKWLGGNLAFDYPINEDVIDHQGNWLSFGLEEVLNRLNDFEGHRGNVPIAENILDRAFSAYKFSLMTEEEKVFFENYVRERGKGINPLDLIRNGVIEDYKLTKHRLLEG